MKVADYRIVRGADSNDLQSKVREALSEGWDLMGAPLTDGRNLLQAMTLEAGAVYKAELTPIAVSAAALLATATTETVLDVQAALEEAGATPSAPAEDAKTETDNVSAPKNPANKPATKSAKA